jgi:HPt (histidine-containing phosphotransfer) domain-containing protein
MTPELRHDAVKAGIDFDQALERLGGDEALFVELAGLMVDDGQELLGRIRGAVERGEAAELRQAAHKAKGALAIFGQGSAVQLASDLERYGVAGEITAARHAFPAFESELGHVLTTLSRIAAA